LEILVHLEVLVLLVEQVTQVLLEILELLERKEMQVQWGWVVLQGHLDWLGCPVLQESPDCSEQMESQVYQEIQEQLVLVEFKEHLE
jgi:hypothetical protein